MLTGEFIYLVSLVVYQVRNYNANNIFSLWSEELTGLDPESCHGPEAHLMSHGTVFLWIWELKSMRVQQNWWMNCIFQSCFPLAHVTLVDLQDSSLWISSLLKWLQTPVMLSTYQSSSSIAYLTFRLCPAPQVIPSSRVSTARLMQDGNPLLGILFVPRDSLYCETFPSHQTPLTSPRFSTATEVLAY